MEPRAINTSGRRPLTERETCLVQDLTTGWHRPILELLVAGAYQKHIIGLYLIGRWVFTRQKNG